MNCTKFNSTVANKTILIILIICIYFLVAYMCFLIEISELTYHISFLRHMTSLYCVICKFWTDEHLIWYNGVLGPTKIT